MKHLIDQRPIKNGVYLDSDYSRLRRRRPRWPIPLDALVAIALMAVGVAMLIGWRPW